MANTKQKQLETLANIDTAIAMTGRVMALVNMLTDMKSLSVNLSMNPIAMLLDIFLKFKSKDDLVKWLSWFLNFVTPVLEVGVKTIMLTNLKHMVSCSIDPRIPPYMRIGSVDESGITVSLDSIDFLGKLDISPLGPRGTYYYFGVDGVHDIGKLVRAQDFDAFLWLVVHRGKFPNAGNFDTLVNNQEYNIETLAPSKGGRVPDKTCIFNAIEITTKTDDNGDVVPNRMVPGSTFTSATYSNGSCVAMCTNVDYNPSGVPYSSVVVPISQNAVSLNWYADPTRYASNLLGNQPALGKFNDSWNYDKEKAICNLEFLDEATSMDGERGIVGRKIKFKILPEPYAIGLRRVHLNRAGELGIATSISTTGGVERGSIPGIIKMTNEAEAHKKSFACYNGLTVYEFNFDYVMSLKLFDAKTLAVNLINSLMNADIGINFGFSYQYIEGREKLIQIVKQLVQQSDEVEDDCFYTFDNSKYDALIRQTAERKAKQHVFGNGANTTIGNLDTVKELLSEYETTTDLHSKTQILERVFAETTAMVTDGMDDSSKFSVSVGLTEGLIENLTLAIIEAILTPKVLLLFEVNSQLMGGTWEKPSFEDLLSQMSGLIVSIVKEIKDLLLQELLKLVLSALDPIIQLMHSMILREALDDYIAIMRNILENCPFMWFKFGANLVDTQLDNVDYADIMTDGSDEHERPQITNC